MEITLQQMLDARERRAAQQRQLLAQYHKPLICFTMNIAGPVKNSDLITRGFQLGLTWLRGQLSGSQLPVLYSGQIAEPTGCEAYYVINASAEKLKQLTVEIEDSQPIGRLFDMDVLDADGHKLGRETLGLPGRTCLLCGKPAHICGRSRAHTVAQLQEKTTGLLQQALYRQDARHIGSAAVRSLLYEVCTTPKPGLVDCNNSGSHQDMDIFTFMSSSAALQPYFEDCARIGLETAQAAPSETFRQLRLPGKLAEQAMLSATGGVNTHKGAIFSLGILCGAAGRLGISGCHPESLLSQCAAMTQGITSHDFADVTEKNAKTAGQKLYAAYGITGVRGQAEAGFPAVLEIGLPILEQGLKQGFSLNAAGCAALLHILCAATDTNLIARSDLQTQRQITEKISALLKEQPFPELSALQALDLAFIRRNLSPGGSADLLAVAYFLHFLCADTERQ